jgi:hypothetical protein
VARQFAVVVAVAPPVELLVPVPALPHAASASKIIRNRANNLFMDALYLRT